LPITADCEKTAHNLLVKIVQFIISFSYLDKKKRMNFKVTILE
jgi:hypothetical protein